MVDRASFPAPEWYDLFRDLTETLAASALTEAEVAAAIAAIATALGSPDGNWETIPPLNFLPKTTNVTAGNGLSASGSLASGGVEISMIPLAGSIGCTFDGGGNELTVGAQCDIRVPWDCEIVGATLLADQGGNLVVDVWGDAYASYPPTVADAITGAAKPTLSGTNKDEDTTLTGWDTTLVEGQTLRFNIDSCATITRAVLQLEVIRV